MTSSELAIPLESFQTFGDLLKYLRRRARLTQRELSVAVKYSEAQISRLEQNQRPPDLAAVTALFIPALYIEDEPEVVTRLMELAAQARGEMLPAGGTVTFSHSGQQEIKESVRVVEENIANNLPLQLTSFVGREAAIATISKLLDPQSGNTRLITLTGPGGMGKTRLALQTTMALTHHYRDGIWFVDLTPLTEPELIPRTLALSLNILQQKDQTLEESILKNLHSKQLLILMDNCEHLIDSAAQLIEKILRSCARVQVLATSREALKLPGEVNFRVSSLSLPEAGEMETQNMMEHEAVQLFIERARTIQPAFAVTDMNVPVIARICQQLDGMPLAIELAAARCSVLSVSQIESRLHDRLRLLAGGQTTLPRHQTLRATLQWSYDMLSEAEKVLFRWLSVFAGGWTLEAANQVCADVNQDVLDRLSQLVNKSFVVVEGLMDTEVRYRMLETIREFAREQLLGSGEMDSMRARHFDYFLQMAQQGESSLFAEESSIDQAETEIDNLRAALSWALTKDANGLPSEERAGRGLDLMLHIWPLWLSRGYSVEGSEWLNQLLAVHTAPTPSRARALLLVADLAGMRGDEQQQRAAVQESLALARKLNDKKRIGWALMEMGAIERERHHAKSVQFLTESLELFQELNDPLWVCRTSYGLAQTHMINSNLETARRFWEQGLQLCRETNDKWQMAWGLEGLGDVERLEGQFGSARQHYEESLKLKVLVRDEAGIAYSLEAFAQLAMAQREFGRAAVLCGAAERLRQALHSQHDRSRETLRASLSGLLRPQLSEETFAKAWGTGRAMQMQEAIEFALT